MRLNAIQRGLLLALSHGACKAPDISGRRTPEATVATLKRLRARGLVVSDGRGDAVSTWTTYWSLTAAGRRAIGKGEEA